MTNNLKIEVLVSNIPEDGSIASQFPSQEYVNQQLAKKANLSPEGRLDPSHAPDYTEIPGLYEHIEDTKDAIETSIADSLQDAKGYTNQQLSTGLQTKADLVNGKIPFDQIPFSADIEDQIQINVENITAVVDQKVAQVVEQVNGVATAANSYTDAKVAENKTYVDTTVGNVIEDVERLGVSKAVTIPTYLTPEAGVSVGTGVAVGAYYNVRSEEDDSVAVEYQNVGGVPTPTGKSYPSSQVVERLQEGYAIKKYLLDNGVEESELDGDYDFLMQRLAQIAVDKGLDASFVVDGDTTQKQINYGVKTYLDNFPFYIPFSPLVTDYSSQFKIAIESGRPIVLTKDASYPFLTPVNAVVTTGVTVNGNNATLSYDGATHIGDFIKIASSVAVKHYFYLSHVDGKHKATRLLYVESSQNNSNGESEFYFNNSSSKRAKRKAGEVFLGGSGIHVRGAFKQISLEYSNISDCMLGIGAGTGGSVGISGLSVTHLTQDSYPLNLTVVGGVVEKVYSEDPTYTADQDGMVFFSAIATNKAGKKRSIGSFTGVNFKNCWGRSIKTQCRKTVVTANNFYRNEGSADFHGNGEVDIQTGQGEVFGNTYDYENGYTGGACVSFGSDIKAKRSTCDVYDNDVYLDGLTTLPRFTITSPRDGKLGVVSVRGNKVFGKVINFATLYVRGAKNIAIFKQNYVESIELDNVEQRNFIEIRSSGSVEGETNFINIEAENNINDGVDAALVKDGVAGVGINSLQSGFNNLGFLDSGAIATAQGQKTFIPFRASGYASKDGAIIYSSTSASIAAGVTQSFTLPANASLLNVQMRGVPAASAVIAHGANGALMSQVGTGNVVYSNGTVEPVTQGTILTIWRDATDANKLNVKNNNSSSRFVSIHFFTS